MGGQYLVVRFETLCTEPRESVEAIADFVGCGMADSVLVAREFVTKPASLGRWRNCNDPDLLNDIQLHARTALEKFGYEGA
jgi:predicted methyltransferase